MLTLLVATNNTAGCESKHWLLKHHVVFQERNMLKQPLNVNEIKELLSLTENGCWDIVSNPAKTFKVLGIDADNLKLSHFIKLLANNNSLIESPILIDNQRILIGFNEKEIRSFLPRQVKREEMDLLLIKTR